MEKYIVLFNNGKSMVFKTYSEANRAADRYMKATGKVACIEQFWSVL